MRTDDLVGLLSTGITPVRRGTAARRFGISLPIATLGATALMAIVFGVRPDLAAVAKTPIFWEKLAFPLSLAIGALIATVRLARPGARVGAGWPVMTTPVLAVWIAAIVIVVTAAPEDRLPALLGHSWRSCPFNILLLAVPASSPYSGPSKVWRPRVCGLRVPPADCSRVRSPQSRTAFTVLR